MSMRDEQASNTTIQGKQMSLGAREDDPRERFRQRNWRGIYPRVFPHQLVRGYLYPAVGFALWHLAPQSIHPSRMSGGT